MVSSEEIIERSFYMNILAVALKWKLTLDPEDYLIDGKVNAPGEKRFQADKASMSKFVYIFGIGNNQERGIKEVPRITLELQGYYPGTIGMERYQLDDTDKMNPFVIDTGYCTRDVVIDVHLVSKTQADMRLLHNILYKALPALGYIKPFYNDREKFFKTGLLRNENIYIEVGNYYDHPDNSHGLLEHVYQYKVSDGIVSDDKADMDLVPIRDITCLIGTDKQEIVDYSKLHIGYKGFLDIEGEYFRDIEGTIFTGS